MQREIAEAVFSLFLRLRTELNRLALLQPTTRLFMAHLFSEQHGLARAAI